MIVAGASPGETKMWAAVRENGDFFLFFALAVRITGKLLKVDGYMLRGVWQALNCLFIHAMFCVIATGASPGQTKNEGRGTKNGDFYRATRMHSADYAVARCPSVCHTPVLCLNGYTILKVFSPSGSPTILIFPYQTGWQYFDGNPP